MKLEANFSKQAIDAFIKIAAIAILLYWCFSILRPFILLVVWGNYRNCVISSRIMGA